MRNEIKYTEIIEKWNQDDPYFWEEVKAIVDSIPSKNPKTQADWKRKLSGFVNNFIVEESFRRQFINVSFHPSFNHEALHAGEGNKYPDFITSSGHTIELISCRDEEAFQNATITWHSSDLHVIFLKNEGKYMLNYMNGPMKDKTKIKGAHLYRPFMPYLEI